MNHKKNLRLMMLFLVLTAIVLAYDHLPKMKAAVSQLADLPTGLNALSKGSLAMSKAVIQPLAAIPVTNTNDSGAGSLRAAIAAAQDGDTIDASGITGTITLLSGIGISKSININGPAAGILIVSGNNSVRVFDITAAAGSTVSMSRLTIANGRSTELVASTGGAGIRNGIGVSLSLDNCIIANNNNPYGVGGINNPGGTLTLTNCTFSGNGPSLTGAISNGATSIAKLTNCIFSHNSSSDVGGAIGCIRNLGDMTLTNCNITDTDGKRGAIVNSGTMFLTGCTLTGNDASDTDGGAIRNLSGTLILQSCTLSDNTARGGNGGAIDNLSGALIVNGCTLSNNTAGNGGAIRNLGSATITGSVITGNSVSITRTNLNGKGGGIFNDHGAGALSVDNCTISNNSHNGADVHFGGGGGILVFAGASHRITNCTFANNSTKLEGGAILFHTTDPDAGGLTISNCTFFGNSTQTIGFTNNKGGAISSNHTLTITSSTFSGNVSTEGGAIHSFGNVTLLNSILAGNTSQFGGQDFHNNGSATSSFSLIGDGTSSGIVNGVNGNLVGVNALLSPLGDYGGRNQTMALLPGSPAINAGSNAGVMTKDQRGVARPQQGTVDMGAFESRGFTLAIAGGNNQSAFVGAPFADPLSVMVTGAGADPVNGGQVTFRPPASGASCTLAGNPATITGGVGTSGLVNPNAIVGGPYLVSAEANGAAPVNFSLSNPMVCPTISVSNPATTFVTVGESFSQTFTQSGSGAPITFTLNSGTLPNGLTLATNGTLSGTPIETGSFSITVKATDANRCSGIGATYTLFIGKASSTITIFNAAALGSPTVAGEPYSVKVILSASAPGVPRATGIIVVSDGDQTCTVLAPGTGCHLVSTTIGSKTITASYTGDENYVGSTSEGVSHQVNKADSTTITTSDFPDPSTVGQLFTVVYRVNPVAPSTTQPSGTVTISDGVDSCSGTVQNGSCRLALSTPGARTLTATYSGSNDHNGSSSAPRIHTVIGPPMISASFSPATVPVGGLSTLTFTITNPNSMALTDVSFTNAFPPNLVVASPMLAGTTCGGTLQNSNGGALAAGDAGIRLIGGTVPQGETCMVTVNVTPTAAGPFNNVTGNVTDSIAGAGNTASATLLTALPTTLSGITSSPDPSVSGQSYTVGFTLNVTPPGAGTPTGTVTVADGAGGTCSATLPATSCALTSTSSGAKTLTITYSGDANFGGSTTTAGHQVNKGNTTTMITSAMPNPSVFGQNYAVTASVAVNSPGSGTPTGTITVTDGTNNCTITLPAISCKLPGTPVGAKTLTATYNGDANYMASPASAGTAHTVNKAETTTTVVSHNPESSAVGQNVTVVFTVVAAAPGSGTPTGNVTVSDGVNSCTGTVAANSCVVALTTPGARTLTATYAGDANFNGGSGSESHTVVAPPSIAKVFTPASTPVNSTTSLTITITNPSANTVALTGVGFTDPFPAGLMVATPLTITNTCGGTLTNNTNGALAAGALGIKLSGGTVNASSGCTVSVKVTPTSAGPFNNVTGNVSSTNGGTGNTATATLATNTPPTITSNTITVKAGSNAASFSIGAAADPDQAVNTLGIAINGNPATASTNGVTVSNVSINANGIVSANVTTTCEATSATFNLVVTDSENTTGTGTLTVTVTPNTPPALSYNAATVTAGTTPAINPASGPGDNGTIASLLLQSVSPNNGGLAVSLNMATGTVTVLSAALAGNYIVTIAATDNCNATTIAMLPVNVVCPAISLNPASLPAGAVNTAYPATLAANPAGGNYTFAVTSGLLPAGLTLNANGSFSGAPAQSGTFNFRVTATGFGSCGGFRDYTLTVSCPAISLAPTSLPGGTIGAAYNQTVGATPSALAGSYGYSVTSGALPNGLMLNSVTGAITGAPTTSGTFNFRIAATSGSCSGTRDYTVTIACASVAITPTLPAGTAGNAYSQTISVTPAAPAGSYTFSLLSGSLPGGLTLNATSGVLSGLLTATGNYSFTIKATAATGCAATQSYTLAINCPSITLSALPAPVLNSLYNQTAAASPSGGGYSFAVTSGTLPAGLSLNAATGLVSGTPATAGAYNFTITATGFGACPGSRAYTGTIAGGGCPAITLLDLPGGQAGQLYNHSVTASPAGSYNYAVTSGSLPPGLTLYANLGMLFGYPTQAGTFNFTITATNTANCTGNRQYSMQIGGAALQSLVFGDFDGDGKADLSVWRGQAGDWLTVNSSDGQLKTEVWGSTAAPYFDVMTPGDYDGDGKMDAAVFRKSTGEWLIKGSKDGAVTVKVWGLRTDVPVPGDYDGDGKTDIAVWRGADSNWYIVRSSDGQTETVFWGSSRAPYLDVPVAADYDGDGKTDIAVFRQANGHWYIKQSSDGQVVDKAWGEGSDAPAPADYDGDGKADIAVWRGSETNWYIVQSSDGAWQTISWGASWLGDVPAPGDYDGDGKADVAVWRASEGRWYVKRSRDNSALTKVHGQPGDTPVSRRPQL